MNRREVVALSLVFFIAILTVAGARLWIEAIARERERLFQERAARLEHLEREDVERDVKVTVSTRNDDFATIGCRGSGVDDAFIKEICDELATIPVVRRYVDSNGSFGLAVGGSSITRATLEIVAASDAQITELRIGRELVLTDADVDLLIALLKKGVFWIYAYCDVSKEGWDRLNAARRERDDEGRPLGVVFDRNEIG